MVAIGAVAHATICEITFFRTITLFKRVVNNATPVFEKKMHRQGDETYRTRDMLWVVALTLVGSTAAVGAAVWWRTFREDAKTGDSAVVAPSRCVADDATVDRVTFLVCALSKSFSDCDAQHDFLLRVAHTFPPTESYVKRLEWLMLIFEHENKHRLFPKHHAALVCWYGICRIARNEGATRPFVRRTLSMPSRSARVDDVGRVGGGANCPRRTSVKAWEKSSRQATGAVT